MNKMPHVTGSNSFFLAIVGFAFFLAPRGEAQTYQYPFQNPALPIAVRDTNVVNLLTTAQKYSLLSENEPAISNLGLNSFTYWTEGIHGLGWGMGGTYTATQFPQGFGLGETWDTAILKQAGQEVAIELRTDNNSGRCGLVLRSPNADLARDPRWGRIEETYGEDPYLIGKLATGWIQGLRGTNPTYIEAASMCKHFLANSNETDRMQSSSNFDQRLLHEYYSRSFLFALMDGGAQSYMTAYNEVNGEPCILDSVFKKLVREEWGWDGAVASDDGSLGASAQDVHLNDTQGIALAIRNGTLSSFDDNEINYGNCTAAAITDKLMTSTDLDTVMQNSMRVRLRLGDLDPASMVPYKSLTGTPWTGAPAESLAYHVTQEAVVLLKNTNNTLPLSKTVKNSIAVIGPRADTVNMDYYGGNPPYRISILQGIKNKLGSGVTVNYALDNTNGVAVNYAKSADEAIVCVGNDPLCGEGYGNCPDSCAGKESVDRKAIILEVDQEALVEEVYQANPNTIVVLVSSFPYAITWEKANIPAIVHIANSSQELGHAIADVLFGDYNPAGRLSMTWPESLSQVPPLMDYDIRDGRTYMYFKDTALFPFGYGLSYTTFGYSNLQTSAGVMDAKNGLTVSFKLTNTGTVAGEEVAQLYVKHLNSAVSRPIKELRDFQRVALNAGATTTVSMSLSGMDVAYWDSVDATWYAECDNIQIQVGASSSDIRLDTTLAVTNCGPVAMTSVLNPLPGKSILKSASSVLSTAQIIRRGPNAVDLVFHLNAATAHVDLRVYSLDGRLIGNVSRENFSAGTYSVALPRFASSSGVYLVSGTTGEGQRSVFKCCVR